MVWLVLQVMAMMVAALSGMFDQWVGKRAGNDPYLFLAAFGFWLMVGVELLYVTQEVLKNMLALHTSRDAFLMLTWERAGIVLGALLVLAAKERRADVRFKINTLGVSLRLLLLCRPLAHVLISLLAGLAVQAAGAVTMVVIAGGTYPFVVAALTYLANTKSPTRLYVYLRGLITLKPKTVGNFVEV